MSQICDVSDPAPSHDSYFRTIFSDAIYARQLFELFLPSDLVASIDLSRLERIEDSFPGNRAGEIRADLVFLCPVNHTDTPVEIVVVVEHKSYRDNRFKEQLLHEWLHLRETRRRIPMLPILFYHGERAWSPTSFQDENRKHPSCIVELQPSVPFIFIDLCRHPDEELANPKLSGITRLALYLLKNIPATTLNIGVLIGLVSQASGVTSKAHLEESMIYLERGLLAPTELDQIEKALRNEEIMRYKSTYEQRREIAIAEGLEQGIEQGKIEVIMELLAKGCDWTFIQDITHVDQAAYIALNEKHGKKE